MWRCRVGISFPVAKVVDYADRLNELEASDNPFAIVVMAHLKTRDTHNDEESRKRWKLYIVRRLYERAYRREDVINLFHFIDWLMRLPEEMEESFWADMKISQDSKLVSERKPSNLHFSCSARALWRTREVRPKQSS